MNDVIKSFLVGLNFKVDDASLSKFNNSIVSASKRVASLYAGIKLATAGIVTGIAKISEGFEQMGYEFRIIAPALNKTLVLRNELLKAYRAAGVDITKTIQSSVKFNMAMAKVQFTLKALAGSVASKFFPLLTKQADLFRSNILRNMPRIIAMIEKFVKFMFGAFEITTMMGVRVWSILQRIYDFFYKLHEQTNGWSTIILGVIAAWKLLNLSFLATPLGMLIAGLTALIVLWDDFQVWREGGESLFDWTSFIPVIDAVANSLQSLRKILDGIMWALLNLGGAIYKIFSGKFDEAIEHAKELINGLKNAIVGTFEWLKNLMTPLGAMAGWVGSLLGGGGSQPTAEQISKWGKIGSNATLPNGVQSAAGNVSNTNQNVTQQTSINVMSSADADATARAVSSQQSRVNFDMARNLKGAVR